VKFLHAADLHIDSPLRGLERLDGAPVEQIRRAPRDAFRTLINVALEEKVDFVILAGDIYDGDWRDVGTGMFFASELRRLGDIPVFIVRGNHDAQSVITKSLRLSANVREFSAHKPQTHRLTVGDLEVALHGQSYANRAVTDDLAAGYPLKSESCLNIGVLHTSLFGFAGHEPYAPTTLDVLRSKGYDYWALGHVHERQILERDPLIVFPGNLQGRHIGEAGAKGCMLVSDEGTSGTLSVAFRSLDVVRWLRAVVAVDGKLDYDAVVAAVNEVIFDAVQEAEERLLCVRVLLRGASPCHADLIARRVELEAQVRADSGAHAWIESLRVETSSDRDMAALRSGDDLVGELFRSVERARTDERRRTELAAALSAVREKIPADVRRAFGTPLEGEEESFIEILDDAERILAAKVIA